MPGPPIGAADRAGRETDKVFGLTKVSFQGAERDNKQVNK